MITMYTLTEISKTLIPAGKALVAIGVLVLCTYSLLIGTKAMFEFAEEKAKAQKRRICKFKSVMAYFFSICILWGLYVLLLAKMLPWLYILFV